MRPLSAEAPNPLGSGVRWIGTQQDVLGGDLRGTSSSSLDFGNQVRVLGEIEHLARRGMAVMLSTHDPDHAFLCAHQVALLRQGRLARRGMARVCAPTLGATGRGARPGRPS